MSLNELKSRRLAMLKTRGDLALEIVLLDDHAASLKAKFREVSVDLAQLDAAIKSEEFQNVEE